jgi:hypothetical protein
VKRKVLKKPNVTLTVSCPLDSHCGLKQTTPNESVLIVQAIEAKKHRTMLVRQILNKRIINELSKHILLLRNTTMSTNTVITEKNAEESQITDDARLTIYLDENKEVLAEMLKDADDMDPRDARFWDVVPLLSLNTDEDNLWTLNLEAFGFDFDGTLERVSSPLAIMFVLEKLNREVDERACQERDLLQLWALRVNDRWLIEIVTYNDTTEKTTALKTYLKAAVLSAFDAYPNLPTQAAIKAKAEELLG